MEDRVASTSEPMPEPMAKATRGGLPHRIRQMLEDLKPLLVKLEKEVQIGVWISACALIVSIFANSVLQDQRDTVKTLRSRLDAFPQSFKAVINERDDAIRELFLKTGPGPVVLESPRNTTYVSNFDVDRIVLRWKDRNELHEQNYIVEIVSPGGNSEQFFATHPSDQKTLFPPDSTLKLSNEKYGPGLYFWRVAPGNTKPMPESAMWSGYLTFKLYADRADRIRESRKIIIGIHFDGVAGNSREISFVVRNSAGEPVGRDITRANFIAKQLAERIDKADGVRSELPIQREFKAFDTIDSLLEEGLLSGKVDFAIGAITRTKARERKGIWFTSGYEDAQIVAVSLKGKDKITEGDKVGFVKGTIHLKAADYLAKSLSIVPIEETTYDDLRQRLGRGELDIILVDKPRINTSFDKEIDIVPSHELVNFEQQELGFPAYAVATRDRKFCKVVDDIAMSYRDAFHPTEAEKLPSRTIGFPCDSGMPGSLARHL